MCQIFLIHLKNLVPTLCTRKKEGSKEVSCEREEHQQMNPARNQLMEM